MQVQDTLAPLGANHRGCHTLLLSLIGPGKRWLNQRRCLFVVVLRARGRKGKHTARDSGGIRSLAKGGEGCLWKLRGEELEAFWSWVYQMLV